MPSPLRNPFSSKHCGLQHAAVVLVILALSSATKSVSGTLFSSAGVSAIQGQNTQVFSEFSTGTSFAAEVGLSGDYRASAIAQTGYRTNHITASAGKDTPSGFSDAGATSRWTDGLFFAGGVGTGIATFVFSLSGTIDSDNNTVGFSFDFDTEDEYCCSDNVGEVFRGPVSVGGVEISLMAEFTFNSEADGDEPLYIEAELFGNATVGRDETGDVSTNFGNSAILTQVIVPDGVTITSIFGTDYMNVIPEPSTISLAALGLLFCGWRRQIRA